MKSTLLGFIFFLLFCFILSVAKNILFYHFCFSEVVCYFFFLADSERGGSDPFPSFPQIPGLTSVTIIHPFPFPFPLSFPLLFLPPPGTQCPLSFSLPPPQLHGGLKKRRNRTRMMVVNPLHLAAGIAFAVFVTRLRFFVPP